MRAVTSDQLLARRRSHGLSALLAVENPAIAPQNGPKERIAPGLINSDDGFSRSRQQIWQPSRPQRRASHRSHLTYQGRQIEPWRKKMKLTKIQDWQMNHGSLLKLVSSESEHSILSQPVGVSVSSILLSSTIPMRLPTIVVVLPISLPAGAVRACAADSGNI